MSTTDSLPSPNTGDVSSPANGAQNTNEESSTPAATAQNRPLTLGVSAIQSMVAKSVESVVSQSLSGFLTSIDDKLKAVSSSTTTGEFVCYKAMLLSGCCPPFTLHSK